MNITFAISGLSMASGPTTYCVKVSDGLARAGCKVDLYVARLVGVVLRPQDEQVRIALSGKSFRPETVPDLLHIHALWNMFSHSAAVYAKNHKIPYIVSAHGMLAPWALRHKWFKKKIAWWVYQKADLEGATMFHVTAACEIKWLRDLGFKQPCVLAPLGSDLPDLDNAATQRRRDVKTVLFVGRIYPVKGLMNLVKAWDCLRRSKVRKCESALVERPDSCDQRTAAGKDASSFIANPSSLPNWQLVLAGPDQAGHKTELMAEAKKLGLSVADIPASQLIRQPASLPSPYDIVFTGPVYGADKDAVYRLADLFVLPSFSENFGVVVTDALSYGIPVITTRGTPWQELHGEGTNAAGAAGSIGLAASFNRPGDLVQGDANENNDSSFILHPSSFAANGRCGWWIDVGVEPLAEALREAMGLSDEERHAMGENGRRLVEAKYTWPAIAEQMKVAYAWILNGGDKPDCVDVL